MYVCVNCGEKVENLVKKYSATVSKLAQCDKCYRIADKYVECDVVLIINDLVLLQKAAYRHVIFNEDFKNFWKLSVILLLMEAYSELMKQAPERDKTEENEEKLFLNELNDMTDFLFYRLSFIVALKSVTFMLVLYALTRIYCKIKGKENISFLNLWKTLTISSFGTFLLLPSLVWDTSVQEMHLCVVSSYTTLSQLLAYTVLCGCPKFWSIFTIFVSYCCKTFCFDFYEMIF